MFEKEEQRSDELETSLKLADSWKRQGDDLLYSMIPRPVAERLRSGQNPLTTCENFEEVSVVFGEIEVNQSFDAAVPYLSFNFTHVVLKSPRIIIPAVPALKMQWPR